MDGNEPTPKHRPSARRRALLFTAAVATLAAAAAIVWAGGLKYRFIPKRFGEVRQGLIYRSGQISPSVIEKTLASHGIELVVSLCAEKPDDPAQAAERQAVQKLGIERFVFPLEGDGTGEIDNYAKAIAAIDASADRGRPVLVHCSAGTYRAGGVVAAYRLLVEHADPALVWGELRRYNWNQKNPILPEYLNRNMDHLAHELVQMGVIDAVPDPLPVLASGNAH